jgi:triacylglycerol esterase/lipase EstA (alpha/beta hydrolase family)
MIIKQVSLIIIVFFLIGCAGPSIQSLIDSADQQAESSGFSKEIIGDNYFDLITYKKFIASDSLIIYIEGDGKGWVTRTQISQNPTPHNPVGLYLALIDNKRSNIAYISRPCQFHLSRSQQFCTSKYWASHRYSDAVIAATSHVISELKRQSGATKITLIGFSGGATVALLAAARRDDIELVKTVAGNVDHQAFTQIHKVTPLSGSLNPSRYPSKLSKVDQIHFVGENDKVVPREIFDSYYQLVGGKCNKLKVVEGVSHGAGWQDSWPKLNNIEPDC